MSFLDLIDEKPDPEPPVRLEPIRVASDLTCIAGDFGNAAGQAVVRNGKCYMPLSPDYWAWMLHKFELVKTGLERGRVSEAMFVEILDRIAAIYSHALARFGKDALDEAKKTVDPKAWDSKIRYENKKAGYLRGRGVAGDDFKEAPEPKTEQTALAL